MLGEELLCVEDLMRRMLFEVRATPSGIDNYRNSRVKSGIDVLGKSFAVSSEAGVGMEGLRNTRRHHRLASPQSRRPQAPAACEVHLVARHP